MPLPLPPPLRGGTMPPRGGLGPRNLMRGPPQLPSVTKKYNLLLYTTEMLNLCSSTKQSYERYWVTHSCTVYNYAQNIIAHYQMYN